MKGGRIAQAGKYEEILGSGEELMELVGAHQDALTSLDVIDVADGVSEPFSSSGAASLSRSLSSAEEKDKQNGKEGAGKVQSGQLVQEEEREKGRVGFWVYWKYITLAYGGALVPFVLIAQILFQVHQIASNYWMAWASPVSKDVEPPVSMSTLIYVFVALAGASSLCILVRALFLVTAAYKTATLLFDKMHMSIFRAPMPFFDSTPSGRILNRVSQNFLKFLTKFSLLASTMLTHELNCLGFS
jgi:ABC-type bacteriocin/lantibiotic exporter with double-glycine peptidase domain